MIKEFGELISLVCSQTLNWCEMRWLLYVNSQFLRIFES